MPLLLVYLNKMLLKNSYKKYKKLMNSKLLLDFFRKDFGCFERPAPGPSIQSHIS